MDLEIITLSEISQTEKNKKLILDSTPPARDSGSLDLPYQGSAHCNNFFYWF